MYIATITKLLKTYGTYEAIAEKTGLNRSTIWRLHNGKIDNPSVNTHNALMKALGE